MPAACKKSRQYRLGNTCVTKLVPWKLKSVEESHILGIKLEHSKIMKKRTKRTVCNV